MKDIDPNAIFAALDKSSRKKNFLYLDKFTALHGCTEADLETWAQENEEFKHILDMTKTIICSHAVVMALTSKLSFEKYQEITMKHFPDGSWNEF
jgi:hypothetical protein